ncbi:two-component system regulatory protein YycI, partial [Companilactobacillus versmoldensis]|uniref:two-component system regulatory protein YycI n=1 Tax=Companilactobacillus versmoldensis TaxID=194326 RepID=UPI0002491D0E
SKLQDQKVQYEEVNHTLASTLDSPIPVTTSNRKKIMDKFIKKESNILYGKNYKYAPQLSTHSQMVYVTTSNLGDVYDKTAQLIFTISDGEVLGYTQTYVRSMIILHERQSIKSEKDVITNLYANSEIPNNSRLP